jgi:hypothetical protein
MSAFWARFDKIEFWLGFLLAFAFAFALGLAVGAVVIASFPTGSSGLRYVRSSVRSDRPRFAFATKIVAQTDKVVGAPFRGDRHDRRRDRGRGLGSDRLPGAKRCRSQRPAG